MAAEDSDAVLLLTEAFLRHDGALRDVRRVVYNLMVEDAWKVAIGSRHYLTTQCLDAPCDAAWMELYRFGKDINFLNTTSFTRPAFEQLLQRFSSYYYLPSPESRGRPPKLRYHHRILGLVLCFYVGSIDESTICMVLGVPSSTLSRILREAEESLSCALEGYAPARISWSSPSHQTSWVKLVQAREPLLEHTFGFIDGETLRVEQPANADLQNAIYNGWLHTAFVTGTICFAADGSIVWRRHNCPGSWNDSDTSLGFRNKLLDPVYCTDKRMHVVSDSAFTYSAAMVGRILTPLKDDDLEQIRPSL